MRAPRRFVLLACLLSAPAIGTPSRIPGALFGGGSQLREPTPVRVDPRLPRGHRVRFHDRPSLPARVCSHRRPVCAHANLHGRELDDALVELESAYERLVWVMALPAPLSDGSRGGSPALDVYLRPSPPNRRQGQESTLRRHPSQPEVRLDPAYAAQDSASAFCLVFHTKLDAHAAARCVAGAIAARLDAAETPATRVAYANHMTSLSLGPDTALFESLDDFQANPQLAALPRDDSPLAPAGASWFAYLEGTLGRAVPGELATAMLTLSRDHTDDLHPEWHNEPDSFDVLRRSLPGGRPTEALVLSRWARHRWFLGERSVSQRPAHLPWLGRFGRPSFDWNLRYSSLPRKVASSRALEPTGVATTYLELDEVPLGASLGVVIDWEEPVRFAWMIIGVDVEGRELMRWELPFLQTGTHQEKTLLNFEAAEGLLFIGVNLGGVDAQHPFDPDAEPWEPHAYTLYLADLSSDPK